MRSILVAGAVVLIFAGAVSAQPIGAEKIPPQFQALSSGTKTGDAAILARAGFLRGIRITADGTTACKVDLYDNASAATGTKVNTFNVGAGIADTQGDNTAFIPVANGIYADMTTTGTCTYVVLYW